MILESKSAHHHMEDKVKESTWEEETIIQQWTVKGKSQGLI